MEVRGEFKPIQTNVPGIQICEHLPRLAKLMDKMVLIRSIVGATGDHYAFQCLTGRRHPKPATGRLALPGIGAVQTARICQQSHSTFRWSLSENGSHAMGGHGRCWFSGHCPRALQARRAGKLDMVLNGITLDRLADRKLLLASFDRFRRDVDASGLMEGLDAFNEQAFGMLTSSQLLEALDFQREEKQVIERYGKGTPRTGMTEGLNSWSTSSSRGAWWRRERAV